MESSDRCAARPAAAAFKAHWPLADDVVFLNHGSFGACPRVVLAEQDRLRREMESGPVRFLARRSGALLDEARGWLAAFLGADPANLVFVGNATSGVNAVVRSLTFAPGDEILTTDHAYNACRNVLVEAARRAGATLVTATVPFPLAGEAAVVAAVMEKVTARTRLALLDHVTSDSAVIFPLRQLVAALAARGVDTLVDGAHAPGMVPLELEALGAAYYTGNFHKWLCAPKAAGFLHVRPDRQEAIQPPVISHGNNRQGTGRSAFQERFAWPGTCDPTPWLCAPFAARWLGGLVPGGWPEIYARQHAMVTAARRLLCAAWGTGVPCPEEMLGAMATVALPDPLATARLAEEPDPVGAELFSRHGIEVQLPRFGGRRWLRISAHLHNAPAEYEYLAAAVAAVNFRFSAGGGDPTLGHGGT